VIALRPATPADAEAVLAVILARDLADVGEEDYTLDDVHGEWADPGTDMERDTWVVEAEDGLAAYARAADDGQDVYVHPDHCGRGIGTALLEAVERRAGEQGWLLKQYLPGGNTVAGELLSAHGYAITNRYWRMVGDLTEAPPAPVFPEDVWLRPYVDGDDEDEVHTLIHTSFSEIPGNINHGIEQWRQRMIRSATYDPSLWLIATDGERIVGVLTNEEWKEGNMGWCAQLAVRPDHRRQGLGRALLLTAFGEFHRRGRTRVGFGVHGENDRAIALYESLGARPAWRHDRYERPGPGL